MIVIPAMIAGLRARRVMAAPPPAEPGLVYRTGMVCATCGGANWWIGRFQVECGYCATVLGLPASLTLEIVRQ